MIVCSAFVHFVLVLITWCYDFDLVLIMLCRFNVFVTEGGCSVNLRYCLLGC